MATGPEEDGIGPCFDYFMVRSRRSDPSSPDTLCGVVERLRTGEKRSFGSGDELLDLLRLWACVAGNMREYETSGNISEAERPGDDGREVPGAEW